MKQLTERERQKLIEDNSILNLENQINEIKYMINKFLIEDKDPKTLYDKMNILRFKLQELTNKIMDDREELKIKDALSKERYEYNIDSSFYDKKTGLTWRRLDIGYVNYHDALTLCRNIKIGDYVWRLPTFKEIKTLGDDLLNEEYWLNDYAAVKIHLSKELNFDDFAACFIKGDVTIEDKEERPAKVLALRVDERSCPIRAFPPQFNPKIKYTTIHKKDNYPIFNKVEGIFYEEESNLTWYQPTPNVVTWPIAQDIAKDLTLFAHKWRLPTKEEAKIIKRYHNPNLKFWTVYFDNNIELANLIVVKIEQKNNIEDIMEQDHPIKGNEEKEKGKESREFYQFVINEEGNILDQNTKLIWDNTEVCDLNHNDLVEFIKTIPEDWRLPTIEELKELDSPILKLDNYWSSTRDDLNTTNLTFKPTIGIRVIEPGYYACAKLVKKEKIKFFDYSDFSNSIVDAFRVFNKNEIKYGVKLRFNETGSCDIILYNNTHNQTIGKLSSNGYLKLYPVETDKFKLQFDKEEKIVVK